MGLAAPQRILKKGESSNKKGLLAMPLHPYQRSSFPRAYSPLFFPRVYHPIHYLPVKLVPLYWVRERLDSDND